MKTTIWIKALVIFALIGSLMGCTRVNQEHDPKGNNIPGSMTYSEKIDVNGARQWIYVHGSSPSNPVILWLNGSLGASEVGQVRKYLDPLHKSFTIVCWDQRGTDRSSFAVTDPSLLKVNDFVKDVISISQFLTKRFNKQNIYLVGHGWGSVIGLKAVAAQPELYAAFVSVGQRVNTAETDALAYERVIQSAQIAGDTDIAQKLKEQGPPPYTTRQNGRYPLLFECLEKYSVIYQGKDDQDHDVYSSYLFASSSRRYRQQEIKLGLDFVYPQLSKLDFETEVPSVNCPIFFVVGRYDYITPPSITERYYKKIDAPIKDMIVLEATHNPCFTQPTQFTDYMVETVLAKTK